MSREIISPAAAILPFCLAVLLALPIAGCKDSLGIDPEVREEALDPDNDGGKDDLPQTRRLEDVRFTVSELLGFGFAFPWDVQLKVEEAELRLDTANGQMLLHVAALDVRSLIPAAEYREAQRSAQVLRASFRLDSIDLGAVDEVIEVPEGGQNTNVAELLVKRLSDDDVQRSSAAELRFTYKVSSFDQDEALAVIDIICAFRDRRPGIDVEALVLRCLVSIAE